MDDTPNPATNWPVHFVAYNRTLRSHDDPAQAEHARGQLWLILNSVIFRSANYHASRYGGVPREELEDLAAQKALDLLTRLQSGDLDLSDREPQQLMAYLSSVAEHGLMDLFRQRGRSAQPIDKSSPEGPGVTVANPAAASNPEHRVASKTYAKALRNCAGKLENRARTIWIFRALYEMTSKEISSHPEVRVKPSYIDVILQRTRDVLRECMRRHGHDTHQIPPGVAVELWRAFRLDESGTGAPG
jgi:DNA-directed RNA polymerase specialized sigma24 family protein